MQALNERERIQAEYARRERQIPSDRYSLLRPQNLFMQQQRHRALLREFVSAGVDRLADKTILDVGCGEGHHLLEFLSWGATPSALAGIDLLEPRIAVARARFGTSDTRPGGPDVRVGDASELPWPSEHFDIVHQGTVFTSIRDDAMKRNVAGEMLRVLKRRGTVIWYDFLVNNPRNPHVRGIGGREIRALFPGCDVRLQRITLAPPLTARLVPLSWVACLILEKLRVLNTHYLAVIRKG